MKVIVTSTNPVKVHVANRAFGTVFPDISFEFVAIKSESGVPNQPMNDETRLGARNRLSFCRQHYPEADYWISQEGGLHTEGERLFNRAWIAVSDADGFIAESSTPHFYIPTGMVPQIKSGSELSQATDDFFSTRNSGQTIGLVGHITDGLIDREEYYLQAAIIALTQLKHKEWYQ